MVDCICRHSFIVHLVISGFVVAADFAPLRWGLDLPNPSQAQPPPPHPSCLSSPQTTPSPPCCPPSILMVENFGLGHLILKRFAFTFSCSFKQKAMKVNIKNTPLYFQMKNHPFWNLDSRMPSFDEGKEQMMHHSLQTNRWRTKTKHNQIKVFSTFLD